MAVQPYERMVPVLKSPNSYFRPNWQVGQWSNFSDMNFEWQKQFQLMERQMHGMERHMEEMFRRFQQLLPADAHRMPGNPMMIENSPNHRNFNQHLLGSNDFQWKNNDNWRMQNPITVGKDGKPVLKLTFDVRQYRPEEVTVKTMDQQLVVRAKHQDDSPNSKVYREYNRQFLLPPSVNPVSLKSVLSPEGILSIEAPVNQAIEGPKEIAIPIEYRK